MGAILITNGRPGVNRASVMVLLYDAGTSTAWRAPKQPVNKKRSVLAFIRLIAAKLCSPVQADRNYRGSDERIREPKTVYRSYIGWLSERAMTKVATRRN